MSDASDDPIWEVVCTETRSQNIFVRAPTSQDAIDAATNLLDSTEWNLDDDDFNASEVTTVPETHACWTGGESGHWESP